MNYLDQRYPSRTWRASDLNFYNSRWRSSSFQITVEWVQRSPSTSETWTTSSLRFTSFRQRLTQRKYTQKWNSDLVETALGYAYISRCQASSPYSYKKKAGEDRDSTSVLLGRNLISWSDRFELHKGVWVFFLLIPSLGFLHLDDWA